MTPLMRYREGRGVSQRSIAVALNVDPKHYRNVERGESHPSIDLADRIAKHFGNAVTRDQILYPADYPAPSEVPVKLKKAA